MQQVQQQQPPHQMPQMPRDKHAEFMRGESRLEGGGE
jgi:hypothetical protein